MFNDFPSFIANTSPSERLLERGSRGCSDAELLAVLIRASRTQSSMELSHQLLEAADRDLYQLGRMSAMDMTSAGMSTQSTAILQAALELGRRRRETPRALRERVSTSLIAYDILRPLLLDLNHEEFWLLLLDRANGLIGKQRISQGGMHATVVDPKIVFKCALNAKACCVILAHNHPSGALRPSEEDLMLTRKLVEGGKFLDIQVNDHLIVTDGGYYSFADNGQL
ncbi:MAG: DNA repair protein RadC [Flavobacteriales bacterium]|nr:MAG: DNA repair protein RadC [Flavobacteriales bacterium]